MSEAILSPPSLIYPPVPHGLAKLEQFLTLLNKPLKTISALAVLFVLAVACIDVTGRTLFHWPLPGGMEITELAMAMMVFPLFSYIMLHDSHLNVEMFFRKLSLGWQAVFNAFSWTLSAIYVIVLANQIWKITLEKVAIREHTYFLDIPLYLFTGFGAICTLLFGGVLVLLLLKESWYALRQNKAVPLVLFLGAACLLGFLPFYFASSLAAMSKLALGGLGMLYLFVLILMGMPIGMAMLIVGFQGILLVMPNMKIAFAMVGGAPYTSMTAIHLSVIPMFLLMGELALVGGISAELFRTANAWLGRLPGGLAVATVTGCAGFAAVCGESIPTAMTMASVSLPEMRKKGYDPAFGAACLSLGGTLGILIPPSMGFIIYSIIVEESVGKLFMAGIVPGILLVVVICSIIIIRSILNPELAPRGEYTPWREKIISLLGLIPMLLLFGVIIGGMLTGTCTPAEGGAVGSLAALLYAYFHGKVSVRRLWEVFKESTILTGKIFLILMGVTILGYFLAVTRLPFALADLIIEMNVGPMGIILGTVVLYIVLGCLMNVIPMIMLTLPALFPTIVAAGFDPIWFGVVCVLLMELGQLTPPIGVLVFALSGTVPDVPIERIFVQVAPFFLGILGCIFLIILFPQIALWLPNLLFSGV